MEHKIVDQENFRDTNRTRDLFSSLGRVPVKAISPQCPCLF